MRHWLSFFIILAVLVLSSLFAFLFLNNDDRLDSKVWNRFRQQLTDEKITRVYLAGSHPVAVEEHEKEKIVSWLREAAYVKSNRKGHGPTPQFVLTLTLDNGQSVLVAFWGGSIFEVSPRFIDENSQFLVEHPELGKWLREKAVLAG